MMVRSKSYNDPFLSVVCLEFSHSFNLWKATIFTNDVKLKISLLLKKLGINYQPKLARYEPHPPRINKLFFESITRQKFTQTRLEALEEAVIFFLEKYCPLIEGVKYDRPNTECEVLTAYAFEDMLEYCVVQGYLEEIEEGCHYKWTKDRPSILF